MCEGLSLLMPGDCPWLCSLALLWLRSEVSSTRNGGLQEILDLADKSGCRGIWHEPDSPET